MLEDIDHLFEGGKKIERGVDAQGRDDKFKGSAYFRTMGVHDTNIQ